MFLLLSLGYARKNKFDLDKLRKIIKIISTLCRKVITWDFVNRAISATVSL